MISRRCLEANRRNDIMMPELTYSYNAKTFTHSFIVYDSFHRDFMLYLTYGFRFASRALCSEAVVYVCLNVILLIPLKQTNSEIQSIATEISRMDMKLSILAHGLIWLCYS